MTLHSLTLRPPLPHTGSRHPQAFSADMARMALRCLHAELVLHPKPGLVSLFDNGSHGDMTAATFMRSMFALRHYFKQVCQAGQDQAAFTVLKRLAIHAEQRMLRATAGINTHRGAIFSLGLLCAAAGSVQAQGLRLSPQSLQAAIVSCWGEQLTAHAISSTANTHGQQVVSRFASSGARQEGALGLPSVFEIGLPALHATLAAGRSMRHARIDTLFALMAHISDTNVVHRGGMSGALIVKRHAQHFIAMGGSANLDWHSMALKCHHVFVAQKLSPGGAADLLAATCLVHAITTRNSAGENGPIISKIGREISMQISRPVSRSTSRQPSPRKISIESSQ